MAAKPLIKKEGFSGARLLKFVAPSQAGGCFWPLWWTRQCALDFFVGLIDAANSFEPSDWMDEHLRRILWVMCGSAGPAIRAADILLRDGNLPVVVLDLQMLPMPQLRRIPASTWHRFQRIIESTAVVLTVLTPQPVVEAATTRMAIRTDLTLDAMHFPRPDLWEHLDVQIFERGIAAFVEVFQKSA